MFEDRRCGRDSEGIALVDVKHGLAILNPITSNEVGLEVMNCFIM